MSILTPAGQRLAYEQATTYGVPVGVAYTFRMGDGPPMGPYSLGYAMGMATVLMHLGEGAVTITRTVTYRAPDGTTYEKHTQV